MYSKRPKLHQQRHQCVTRACLDKDLRCDFVEGGVEVPGDEEVVLGGGHQLELRLVNARAKTDHDQPAGAQSC